MSLATTSQTSTPLAAPVAPTAPERNLFNLRQTLNGRERVGTAEAARLLDCNRATVRRLVLRGILRADWERALPGPGSRYSIHVDSLLRLAGSWFEARAPFKQRGIDRLTKTSIRAEESFRAMGDHEAADRLEKVRLATAAANGGGACQ